MLQYAYKHHKVGIDLILIACFVVLAACTSKEVLDDAACVRLALCIPDHVMKPQARPFFTEEYLVAWDAINALPDEAEDEGYLPEKEWIYYFVTGNGDCEDLQVHIEQIYICDSTASVRFYYTCNPCDDGVDGAIGGDSEGGVDCHMMYLVYRNNHWLIDEYDTTKQDMISWVADATASTASDSADSAQ